MTYMDIYNRFEKQFPNLNVDDWRPYGKYTITVWIRANDEMKDVEVMGVPLKQAKNVIELAFEYDVECDTFIFRGNGDYAKLIGQSEYKTRQND